MAVATEVEVCSWPAAVEHKKGELCVCVMHACSHCAVQHAGNVSYVNNK